tara:strand:- start:1813 stop:2670 length:858 start_codon:yes stop_codon:yes gene_type:complete
MSNFSINAKKAIIPDSSRIGENVTINCEHFEIGENTFIGDNVRINCRKFVAGSYLYMTEGVEVGRGGCFGPRSNVIIGNNVGIFENAILNPSESISIGDNSGIGGEVMIWTHGAWLDVLSGFPSSFGPVKIGKNVWLPARTIVLPNSEIGDNCVISVNSVVNRNLPNGCLAGGNPVTIIKEGVYPRILNSRQKRDIIDGIISDWVDLLKNKSHGEYEIRFEGELGLRLEETGVGIAVFNFESPPYSASGDMGDLAEDLRDYLRRRGIKIYTGEDFRSILPRYMDN